MRVSMRRVALELKACCGTTEIILQTPDAMVGRPLLLQTGAQQPRGRVFLLEQEPFGNLSDGESLYVLPAGLGAQAANRVLLARERDAARALNALQALFDRFEQWEDAFHAAAAAADPLDALLAAGERQTGSPLLLLSQDGTLAAQSPRGRSVSAASVPSFPNGGSDGALLRLAAADGGASFLALVLTGGREDYLLLLGTPGARDVDGETLLRLLAGAIRPLFGSRSQNEPLRERTDARRELETFVRRAAENEKADPGLIAAGFRNCGWLATHEYCFVQVRVDTFEYRPHVVRLFCRRLEMLAPEGCAFSSDGFIVLLINLTLSGGSAEDAVGRIACFLRDNYLKAGVSDAFTGTGDLFSYCRQARVALEYGCTRQSYRWIARFPEIALDYLVEQCAREMPLSVVCQQGILRMRAHDEIHGTAFYDTLKRYIACGFNAVQTAKALYIHRSTFLYRMERIRDEFHVDLSDADTLLYVMLTVRMLEAGGSIRPQID